MAGGANIMWIGQASGGLVTSGLVLYYNSANSSSYPGTGTTITDLSGNSNTGTMTGAQIAYNSGSNGIFIFGTGGNNTGSYINTPHATSIDNLGALTMSMWLNISTTSTYSHMFFYKSDNNGSAGYFLELSQNVGGSGQDGLSLCIVGSTDARYCIPRAQVPTGQWINLVATWNGVFPSPTITFYINGVQNLTSPIVNTTGAGTRNTDAAQNLTFGLGSPSGSSAISYLGSAGPLQMYNRVLSAGEIDQNFQFFRGLYGI
jgi:hypothetical protein